MRRNRRFTVLLLILILLSSTLMSGASTGGIGSEKIKVIISFHEQPGPKEVALIRAFGGSVKFTYHIVPAIAATLPQAALEGLARNPQVKWIEPDGEIHLLAGEYPWGINRVGAETVHSDPGVKGAGIAVAVIDSGVDYRHPDLNDNYAGGYDFVNRDSDPLDDNGHGTHVAGTIAAELNGTGVVGAAPQAKIYALKVLNRKGSGDFSNVIAALQWCVDFNAANAENGDQIRITNNSYGGSVNPDLYGYALEEAFNAAYSKGILHIAAAGNEGDSTGLTDTVGYPAKYPSVVAVAATDSADLRAYFSSTGNAVELAAPGYGIYSTVLNGSYATYSGTSMASPHVAGVAALVMAAHPGLSNAEVRDTLNGTAKDLGADGPDPWYGHGLVDALRAVGTIVTPDPEDSPVDPPTPDPVTVSVDRFDGVSSSVNKIFWKAAVNLSLNADLSNVAVTGQWTTGSTVKNVTAYTDASGNCVFDSGNISTKINSASFKLTGMTLSGYNFTMPSPDTLTLYKPVK